jgi:hypothetical protein
MKKEKIIILFFALIFFSAFVQAQISREITKMRCGDGILDEFEMCEKEIETDRCEKMGELLKIATFCRTEECVCAPFVKQTFCGNNRREGAEMCDGTGEDLCPQYGEMIGIPLVCNKETCICDIAGGVPATYDPSFEEEEKEEGMPVCGDGILHSMEECDPPNTLCILESGKTGICAPGCICVETESIGIEDEIPEDQFEEEQISEIPEENKTDENEITEELQENEKDSIEKDESKEKISEIQKKGFFARLFEWLKEIFK